MAFEVLLGRMAVNNCKFWIFSVDGAGILGKEHTTEISQDRNPALSVQFVQAFAPERFLQRVPRPQLPPQEKKNGGSDCCHCPIRRPRPITGFVRSRSHLGGCLLAARRISFLSSSGLPV
ncbi:hypothetical protein RM543_11715 [Roseicyclus sp. F158]|uniref:Uncharacterized protein n=1 Tax=Tropicimonas omnivorans TaxID=3075590 RepID=A0ABU3DI33_9RHOB|nr:hypothetical protein [Roseicyclus sp. F158]MDT0683355.1 hypothetical protein [Roseicyclus sp. F158]